MDDASASDKLTAAASLAGLDAAVASATEALLKLQRPDGHWVFELEADATIPAEYMLFVQYLGETADLELERKIGVYLRRIQGEHGGWPLYHGGALDVSATVKAYFALKMIGDDPAAPHMVRAREALLAHGGAGACNVFTRILLASSASSRGAPCRRCRSRSCCCRSGSRSTSTRSPTGRGRSSCRCWCCASCGRARATRAASASTSSSCSRPPSVTKLARGAHQKEPWATFFSALDRVLQRGRAALPEGAQQRAIDKAVAFVTERLNGEDGLGGIFPAMVNSVMMYAALGVPESDPRRAIARASSRSCSS